MNISFFLQIQKKKNGLKSQSYCTEEIRSEIQSLFCKEISLNKYESRI